MHEATTISDLRAWKAAGKKFASVTAYDACFARIFMEAGIRVLLVGDSLGMVLQGHDSTLPETVEDMAYHTSCARRGAPAAFLMADLPFMSYPDAKEACASSAALMRAGANMVKLEGGLWLEDIVRALTERAVPVCAHLGLTPQAVNIFGGYKVQGREAKDAENLYQTALALEQAGAQLLVLECVPAALAKRITAALAVPVIGIGAGPDTDGQILVMHDMLGLYAKPPKFAKNFMAGACDVPTAARLYAQEVEAGLFPAAQHTFT